MTRRMAARRREPRRGRPPAAESFGGRGLACVRGGRTLFENLDFSLEAGGALLLRGPNGSGKTSLLRLMAGFARPAAGRLLWNGGPVEDRREAFRATLAWLGHRDAVKASLTVAENLAFHIRLRSSAATVGDVLEGAGLSGLADVPAGSLSAGQSRRLALARVMAAPALLWLLDEPATGLDPSATRRLAGMVADHRAGGGMAVVSANSPLDLPGAGLIDLGENAGGADRP